MTTGRKLTERSPLDDYATAIAHTLKQPLVVLAADLRIAAANPSFHHTFGQSLDEAEGRFLSELCGDGWDNAEAERVLQAICPDEPSGLFEMWGCPERRAFVVTANLLEDDGSYSILLAFEDVTEQKRQLEQLRQAERRREEFLTMLAHELRNPIAAIDAARQVLQTDPDAGHRRWALEVVERHTKHIARLVEDLMELCRLRRGKLQLKKELVGLGHILARAIEATKPLVDRHAHELIVSLAPGPMNVEADPMRLEQVLVNLLTNAAKYTDRGGRITLFASREGGEVIIRVADTGRGIDPELLPHIFERFTQVEQTMDRSDGGLGIGLAIVRMIVRLHRGEVTATSDGPGRGSEFIVRLPAATAGDAAAADQNVRGAQPRSEKRRILIVDDNADTADAAARLLGWEGHDVLTAHDAKTALELARVHMPEIILLDIGLPDIDGCRLAEMLRREPRLRSTLLIAISGYGQEEDRRRTHAAGFDHHLLKPLDFDSLRTLIAEWGRHRTRPEESQSEDKD